VIYLNKALPFLLQTIFFVIGLAMFYFLRWIGNNMDSIPPLIASAIFLSFIVVFTFVMIKLWEFTTKDLIKGDIK
jgi:hypothetical protein